MTIAIIGGGPAGLYTSYLLAKAGKEVTVIEEHKSIGKPVQCTGIITSHLKDFIDVDDFNKRFVINNIEKVRVYSKTNFLELKLKNPNYIVDRSKFDRYLAELAKIAGVKISLGETYLGNDEKRIFTNKRVLDYDLLIGADGPLSPVAKTNNMFRKRKLWHGIQARVKMKNDNAVEFYPNVGSSAWIVPENKDTVRIGLFAEKDAKNIFEDFLKAKKVKKKDIIEYQSGLIPKFDKEQVVQKNNIFLVGDSACQVKATTGGGIIPGMSAAEALAECIVKDKGRGRYKSKIKKVNKEMKKHLRIRKILDRLDEKAWKHLLDLLNKDKVKKVIEEHDREYPSKFTIKLLLKQPRLLCFLKYLF